MPQTLCVRLYLEGRVLWVQQGQELMALVTACVPVRMQLRQAASPKHPGMHVCQQWGHRCAEKLLSQYNS